MILGFVNQSKTNPIIEHGELTASMSCVGCHLGVTHCQNAPLRAPFFYPNNINALIVSITTCYYLELRTTFIWVPVRHVLLCVTYVYKLRKKKHIRNLQKKKKMVL